MLKAIMKNNIKLIMHAPNVIPKVIMLGFVTKRKVITSKIMVPVIIIIQTRMQVNYASIPLQTAFTEVSNTEENVSINCCLVFDSGSLRMYWTECLKTKLSLKFIL